jgi:transcriptional regulator
MIKHDNPIKQSTFMYYLKEHKKFPREWKFSGSISDATLRILRKEAIKTEISKETKDELIFHIIDKIFEDSNDEKIDVLYDVICNFLLIEESYARNRVIEKIGDIYNDECD